MGWYGRRDERQGQALVETAGLLLFLLLLLMGIIEFGFIFYGYVRVTNATREGARAGSLWLMNREPTGPPDYYYEPTLEATVIEAVWAEFSAVPEDGISVAPPDPADPEAGDPITVTVTYDYPMPIASGLPIISDIIGPNFPLNRTVVMRFQ